MTTFQEYVTREGDRWDVIAWLYYRNPFDYERIIRANPEYIGLLTLRSGLTLRVPVVEDETPTIAPANLPPWRR